MDKTQHNRRSALGILATGPIAMLPALAVMQCSSKADAAALGKLDPAIARYRLVQAKYDQFDTQVHTPALKAYSEAVAKVPHHQTVRSFENMEGQTVTLSTENSGSVAQAKATMARLQDSLKDTDYHAAATELIEAADRRDAKLAELRKSFDVGGLRAKEVRHSDRVGDAMWRAIRCPVGSLDELCRKLDFIDEVEQWDCEDAGEAVAADIRRLAGRG